MSEPDIEAAIAILEAKMPALRQRCLDLPSFAKAWSARCDEILVATPEPLRRPVERRLDRIGVRWGAMAGARLTSQFPAYLPPQ